MGSAVRVVRPLGKHQRIEPNDVAVVRTDLSDLSSDTVRQLAEVIGNRTTRAIYPNTYLKNGMFTPPPLVRRGDYRKNHSHYRSHDHYRYRKSETKGVQGRHGPCGQHRLEPSHHRPASSAQAPLRWSFRKVQHEVAKNDNPNR